ncbi:unnamed protein product [Lymnaea stagnalis]|uniref:CABIT domain-containing protein n=1 Tax=Lymnaea stagnalis TaxID=6523 RepID=A0AAV2I0A6_LYMST
MSGDTLGATHQSGSEPGLNFTDEVFTLEQVLDRFRLPRVIQCDMGLMKDNRLDLSKPLLAFSRRSARKVGARNMQWDCKERELKVMGSDLLIPEDYIGWFAVQGSPGAPDDLKSVTPYRKLSQLSTSRVSSFLVGGISPISGFLLLRSNNTVKNIPHQILPGDVLRKANNQIFQEDGSLYASPKPDTKSGTSTLTRRGAFREKSKVQPYLMYHDEKDRAILLKAQQRGIFYVIGQDGQCGDEDTVALQLKDIITQYTFPLVVKLLHGLVPAVSCGFTGTILLTDIDMEETVVASTLLKNRNTSLEIPLGSDMLFQVAENSTELTTSEAWKYALAHCHSLAPIYTRAIKVIDFSGSIDEDESEFDAIVSEEAVLRKEKCSNSTTATSLPQEPTNEESVQIRPKSDISARRSRISTVYDLSRRVGVYALDYSINPRHLSRRRRLRANAFKGGTLGQQRVDSGVDLGCMAVSPGPGASDLPQPVTTVFPEHSNAIVGHDASGRSYTKEISIPCVAGRPCDSSPTIGSERDSVEYTDINATAIYSGLSGNASPRFCHLFLHGDRFVTVRHGRSTDETNFDEGYSGADRNSATVPLYLFHGSLSSTDDNAAPGWESSESQDEKIYEDLDEVIAQCSNTSSNDRSNVEITTRARLNATNSTGVYPQQDSVTDDTPSAASSLKPTGSYRPPLPERKPRAVVTPTPVFSPPIDLSSSSSAPQSISGCYNREQLIHELKKEKGIDSAVELALRSLTMAEFTGLLYHDHGMVAHLNSILPKLEPPDLKRIANSIRSVREKIQLLTL